MQDTLNANQLKRKIAADKAQQDALTRRNNMLNPLALRSPQEISANNKLIE